MIKIDLVTGFLGAGKTTLIKAYASYLVGKGEKVCILENDYGAINVDMMLIQDLMSENCDAEMVAGGCDLDCHRRRFKTKLINMGMAGYDHVIVEPSGIYDTDEFFDALHEEPLDRWYEAGSVIAVVDASVTEELSERAGYILASEVASAGMVVLSHVDSADVDMPRLIGDLNNRLLSIGADRQLKESELMVFDLDDHTKDDCQKLENCGYRMTSYVKKYGMDDAGFDSVYLMDMDFDEASLNRLSKMLFSDARYGNVIRVKGFFGDMDGGWKEFNATKTSLEVRDAVKGQKIVIIIGEDLDKKAIEDVCASESPNT